MPLVSRLQARNVYGLGQTEKLNGNVDREDSNVILDGVSVNGLLGILRQLGDLTEFAAEIFHEIQEEVMITSSRSNKLKIRLKQIEATVPTIQKKVVAQTNHLHFAYSGGLEWHPRIPNEQNHFVYDELPRFVMSPYDDCRDPPRLHLLDKFDINGQGSCMIRYSDPTYFKRASKVSEIKKKKYVPRSRDISRVASLANHSDRKTFTSLSFSGRTSSSKTASTVETELKSDLQDRISCSFESRSGVQKPKDVLFSSSRLAHGARTIASVLSETESEDTNDSPCQDITARGSSCVNWHEKAEIVETDEDHGVMEKSFVVDDTPVSLHGVIEPVQDNKRKAMAMDSEDETESEGEDFVDALYTIDSESENDYQTKEKVDKKSFNEITEESLEENSPCEQETEKKLSKSNHVGLENELSDQEDQWTASDISNGTHHSYSNGFSNPLYDTNGIQEEHQKSEDEVSCYTDTTKLWTNGNLLGLKTSKPEIVAETIPENDVETLQEPLCEANKEASFDWFTSSPPLDHMKISFNHSETLPSSEKKLKLPEEHAFSTFQLVPENNATTSLQDSDSDKDTFCRSSSYISDNSDNDNHSVSVISEQHWEEESREIQQSKNQQEVYDSFNRINGETSSLSTSCVVENVSYLQNPADPSPPPLPPLQWMVSKIPSERYEDSNKKYFKETLTRALEQRSSLSSFEKEEQSIVTTSDTKQENKVYQKNNVKDYKQSHKDIEVGDFLHQIRTKQFNLRRVVTTKTTSPKATMNKNFSVILEKANSIRQAVASDDGESDTWSDSDT
ncbi:unnamed protein product [Cochlearia groenlandica]